jgi:hypothetical protein
LDKSHGFPGGPSPCCEGSRCAVSPDEGTRCVIDCTPQGNECAQDAECCPVANHDVFCTAGLCGRCGHVNPGTMGAACTAREECCGFASDPLIQCVAGHCNRTCLPAGTTCANDGECCTADRYECSDTTQTCCGRVRALGDPIPGSPCQQETDCCGDQSDPEVRCFQGECRIVPM